MNKWLFYSCIYLLSGVLCACDRPVDLVFNTEPVLVINAIFVEGTDSTAVRLTHTVPRSAEITWPQLRGAVVILYENGKKVAEAQEEDGSYYFRHPVKALTSYKVTVEHPDFGLAWGETTVPAPLQEASIEQEGIFYVNRWLDDPTTRNYYWVSFSYPARNYVDGQYVYDYHSLRLGDLYTTSALPDPFNREYDHSASITNYYEYYVRIEDSGLSGERILFSYRARENTLPFILTTDSHFDAYLKSTLMAKKIQFGNSDFPLFYDVPYIYSNIQGGVGVIGSYCRFERSFLSNSTEHTTV